MRCSSLVALFLLCLPACATDNERPYGPGGGGGSGGGSGGGGGNGIDAMPIGPDAQAGPLQIRGRLCLALDLRDPLACAPTTALAGIVVESLDSNLTTMTASNGSFSLNAPDGDTATLRIAAGIDGYRDLLTRVDLIDGQALDVRLPAIADATWQSLLTEVGVIEPDGTASIATYLESNDQPLTNVEVIAPAGTLEAPLYDGPLGPNDWESGGLTGDKGASIMVGVPVDFATVDFIVSAGAGLQDVIDIPVADGFLSFVPVVVN